MAEENKNELMEINEIQNKKNNNAEKAEVEFTKKVINRGTGAGGAKTNINGKKLEDKTRQIIDNNITSKKC